ncbi:hypothetical protein HPC62_17615 [Thermoleptolyngbya sichuanensis A183]|uniref:Uncharacterized protein n=1 Tax=Thermoleptolyngbya sichuanensis A183 TaxID=2737172 RepID=A0A6M8B8M9_9CYAN|nr:MULTISPECIES: hypothetical protein [Thermoleptolyngbya]QKD83769.1 hypothetical protein HPC62_17615 [Thermoleptolyngbya sichuanensis A183]
MNSTQPDTKRVDTPPTGVKLEQKPDSVTSPVDVDPVDFDQWAIAVRQQMLDALRKRGTRY